MHFCFANVSDKFLNVNKICKFVTKQSINVNNNLLMKVKDKSKSHREGKSEGYSCFNEREIYLLSLLPNFFLLISSKSVYICMKIGTYKSHT